jgi:hypothetical protein
LYASEGHYSQEIDTLSKIDRFGIEAITGRRQFYFGELRKMIYAENLVTAYRSRAQSKNWAEWVNSNPVMADMLADAEKLCQS